MADEITEAAAPAVDTGTAVETPPPTVAPIVPHTETAALLSGEATPVMEPVAEPTPIAEPAVETPPAVTEPENKAPDAAAVETPLAPPAAPEPTVYPELTLPEGVTMDAERLGVFDAIVGKVQLAPEIRQELADLHVSEMQRYDNLLRQQQQDHWLETRRGWRDEIQRDGELWRPGIEAADQPAINAAKRMLDAFIPESRRKAFDDAMLLSGLGDHPEMIRFLNSIAKKFDAPAAPLAPAGPPPDRGGAGGVGRRMRDMYDHPRSRT